MNSWDKTLTLLAVLTPLLLVAYTATDQFTPPTLPDGCACPGDTLNFTCTVVGGTVTIWSGTAFIDEFCTGNQALLVNDQFGTPRAIDDCGPLVATGVTDDNSTGQFCYTSVLTVPITINFNGRTVTCSRDVPDNVIGSPHTLIVAGPPPDSLSVMVFGQFVFTFDWTPAVTCSAVSGYRVNADMADCGTCIHNVNTNTATCTGWTPNGQTCSVSVMSEACGGMIGNASVPLNLTLREVNSPNISFVLSYMVHSGGLQSLAFSFPEVSPVQVAPGLSPAVSYTARVDSQTRDIPESSCNGGMCSQAITDDLPTVDFDFAVAASNGLGNGQVSPTMRVLSDIHTVLMLSVQVAETTATFTLNLLDGFVGTTDLVVEYGMDGIQTNESNSSMAGAGETLSLTLGPIDLDVTYSYTVIVIHNGSEVQLQGSFSSACPLEDLSSENATTNSTCIANNSVGGFIFANGFVCYTGTIPGNAQTSCEDGFMAMAEEVRVCQIDGTWNGSRVQCLEIGTPPAHACSTECIAGITISVIVVVIIILVIVIIVRKKRSGSMKVTSEHEMEGQPKPIDSKPPSSPIENEPEVTGVTFQNEGGKASPTGEQADGGEGANPSSLIYADLDIAKKPKPKAQDMPGAAATKEEEPVQYASIEHFKKDEGTEVNPLKMDEGEEGSS